MSNKDPEKNKEYMREYMKKRYHTRVALAKKLLGGECSRCGSTDRLQFDHKDRSGKQFTICKFIAGCSELKLIEELKKCQLLCEPCHIEKTRQDLNQQNARKTHGTLSSYRYCKCDLCKRAWYDYSNAYRRKRRALGKAVTAPSS